MAGGTVEVSVWVALILLLSFAPVSAPAAAQTGVAEDPPGVLVLGCRWNAHVDRPGWDRDLYLNPIEAADAERESVEQGRPANARTTPPRPAHAPRKYRPKYPPAGTRGFQYRVKVRNAGAKTVRATAWDYLFVDPESGREVARHAFESRERIKPGGSKELIHFSVSAPTKVVSAGLLGGSDARRPFLERVEVRRVEYTDGSSWERK